MLIFNVCMSVTPFPFAAKFVICYRLHITIRLMLPWFKSVFSLFFYSFVSLSSTSYLGLLKSMDIPMHSMCFVIVSVCDIFGDELLKKWRWFCFSHGYRTNISKRIKINNCFEFFRNLERTEWNENEVLEFT